MGVQATGVYTPKPVPEIVVVVPKASGGIPPSTTGVAREKGKLDTVDQFVAADYTEVYEGGAFSFLIWPVWPRWALVWREQRIRSPERPVSAGEGELRRLAFALLDIRDNVASAKIFTATFARVPESMWSIRWEIGCPMLMVRPGMLARSCLSAARNSSTLP